MSAALSFALIGAGLLAALSAGTALRDWHNAPDEALARDASLLTIAAVALALAGWAVGALT